MRLYPDKNNAFSAKRMKFEHLRNIQPYNFCWAEFIKLFRVSYG